MCWKQEENQKNQKREIGVLMKENAMAAVWKYDKELGIAYFCSHCKHFVCASGMCQCGAVIDLELPKKRFRGRVYFEKGRNRGGLT